MIFFTSSILRFFNSFTHIFIFLPFSSFLTLYFLICFCKHLHHHFYYIFLIYLGKVGEQRKVQNIIAASMHMTYTRAYITACPLVNIFVSLFVILLSLNNFLHTVIQSVSGSKSHEMNFNIYLINLFFGIFSCYS